MTINSILARIASGEPITPDEQHHLGAYVKALETESAQRIPRGVALTMSMPSAWANEYAQTIVALLRAQVEPPCDDHPYLKAADAIERWHGMSTNPKQHRDTDWVYRSVADFGMDLTMTGVFLIAAIGTALGLPWWVYFGASLPSAFRAARHLCRGAP